jgi:hypothetical protein
MGAWIAVPTKNEKSNFYLLLVKSGVMVLSAAGLSYSQGLMAARTTFSESRRSTSMD